MKYHAILNYIIILYTCHLTVQTKILKYIVTVTLVKFICIQTNYIKRHIFILHEQRLPLFVARVWVVKVRWCK